MGLTRTIVNLAIKNQKIESFNTYLFVGPHPDDIEIGAGATVSKLIKLKKKVVFLICTDGRFGRENLKEDLSEEQLIERRKEESIKSASYLGVSDVRFLNLCDGNNYKYEDLLMGIASVINDVKPDIIFGPDPDISSECHKDHLNVGQAIKELGNFANYKDIFAHYLPKDTLVNNGIDVKAIALFMTNKPNKFVRTYGHFKKQINALYIHSSQYPKGDKATNAVVLYLKVRAVEYGFRTFSIPSEGFRMMNRTRMHCLPEASK